MKKILILILTFAAVISFTSVPAFAEDTYTLSQKARQYEANGDYPNAKIYYERLADLAAKNPNDKWIYLEASNKARAYTNEFDLYTLTDNVQAFYNAPLVPQSGVYFGECVNSVLEKYPRESMMLVYAEYGHSEFLNTLNVKLSQARELNQVVELALNFSYGNEYLDYIISDTEYIREFCDVLSNYQDLKIFLRIGAEPNDWQPDPEKYKQAFIKVSNAAKTVSVGNIASVWSVTHASSADMNDYYPGDEYADWVGISAYGTKYFPAGDSYDVNSAVFKFGNYADPINIVREVVTRYGDRKPIMIAEGGSAYQTIRPVSETDVDWAVINLKRFYSSVMMKYPQIKLIGYFNQYMEGAGSFYNLSGCHELRQAYDYMTSMPWFIQNGQTSAKNFEKADGSISAGNYLNIYALAYTFGDNQPRVDYRIDGQWVNAALYVPYQTTLDLRSLSDGVHSLEAIMTSAGNVKERKTYTLYKTSAASDNSFIDTDMLNSVQLNAIKTVASQGIINGYEDGTFRPYSSLTRAEFAAMICRLYGYSSNGKCTFGDASGHWASEYIKSCTDAGAVNGIGNNLFAPDNEISTAQAAKILTICSSMVSNNTNSLEYPYDYISAGNAN